MMKKYLVGIRTNNIDFQSVALFNYYRSKNIDVIFCIDELKYKVENKGYPGISINKKLIADMGLWIEIENRSLLWNCGDYFLYAMRLQYPEYDGYWLLEDDALIKCKNLVDFLSLPLLHKIDFSACYIREITHDKWLWKETIQEDLKIDKVMACSFGIVYASKEFCITAYYRRRQLCSDFQNAKKLLVYPNDEGFVMNYIDHQQYKVVDLRSLYVNKDFDNYKYSSHGLISYFSQDFHQGDNGFYHPIIVKQNIKEIYDREVKIYKKQKKSTEHVFDNLITGIDVKDKIIYFAIIFYDCPNNYTEHNLNGITAFYLGAIKTSAFWQKIEDIFMGEKKFSYFYFIKYPSKVNSRDILQKMQLPVNERRGGISVYFDNDKQKLNPDYILVDRGSFSVIKSFFNKKILDYNKVDGVLNKKIVFEDIFENL